MSHLPFRVQGDKEERERGRGVGAVLTDSHPHPQLPSPCVLDDRLIGNCRGLKRNPRLPDADSSTFSFSLVSCVDGEKKESVCEWLV